MVATDECDHEGEAPAYKWNKRCLVIYLAHIAVGFTQTVYEVAEAIKADIIAAHNFQIGQREFAEEVSRGIETLTGGGNG